MPTFLDPDDRRAAIDRLRRLDPTAAPRWGRMTAPQMVAHLCDQMRHTLGDVTPVAQRGPLRLPFVRYPVIHWIPWPRGRVKGPPEAFVSRPGRWEEDVAALIGLVERLADRDPRGQWPRHALFGQLDGRSWGVFCHKHFDHHLRQFGV